MKRAHYVLLALAYSIAVITMTSSNALAQIHEIKVDNFLFLYDASSSMNENYQYGEVPRYKRCLEAMKDVNRQIPDYSFQAGLYALIPDFAPYKKMGPYDKEEYEYALSELPQPEKFIGQQSPLSEGLTHLDAVLGNLSGRTAVILFSDGGENRGGKPVQTLRELYAKHDFCLHFVNYAHQKKESDVIQAMKSVSNCSQAITGEKVQEGYDRKEFVRKIFYSTRRLTLDIKFDFDKSRVKPKYHDELNEIGRFLQRHPRAEIELEGHTCNIGSEEYNLRLSQRRVESVEEYIVQHFDVSPERIATKGYGERHPVASNDSESGREKNRRVEGIFPEIFQRR